MMYYYASEIQHKKEPSVTSILIEESKWEPTFYKKHYPEIFKQSTGHTITSVKHLTKEQFEQLGAFDMFLALRGLDLHYSAFKKKQRKEAFNKLLKKFGLK